MEKSQRRLVLKLLYQPQTISCLLPGVFINTNNQLALIDFNISRYIIFLLSSCPDVPSISVWSCPFSFALMQWLTFSSILVTNDDNLSRWHICCWGFQMYNMLHCTYMVLPDLLMWKQLDPSVSVQLLPTVLSFVCKMMEGAYALQADLSEWPLKWGLMHYKQTS